MRTPEQILDLMIDTMPYALDSFVRTYVIEAVKIGQKEAYNDAIKDAVDNVRMNYRMPTDGEDQATMYPHSIDKESILKLLKP